MKLLLVVLAAGGDVNFQTISAMIQQSKTVQSLEVQSSIRSITLEEGEELCEAHFDRVCDQIRDVRPIAVVVFNKLQNTEKLADYLFRSISSSRVPILVMGSQEGDPLFTDTQLTDGTLDFVFSEVCIKKSGVHFVSSIGKSMNIGKPV